MNDGLFITRVKCVSVLLCLICSAHLMAARLERHRGKVSFNGKDSFSKGQVLKKGDRLVAYGGKSFFVIRYDDGSRFLVRDGELTINKLAKKKMEVGLLKGTLLSYVKQGSGQDFKIKTRTASLGVRGTKFWVSESPKDTYLCVCEGSVAIENDVESLIVSKNEDIRVKSRRQRLSKAHANDMMWNMAVDGFKDLGIDIPPRVSN